MTEDFDASAYFLRRNAGVVAASAWMVERADGEEEEEKGTTTFIASTDRVDRYGDIVEQKWSLADFRNNPAILYEHAPPIIGSGKAKHVEEKGGKKHLEIKVKWDIGEHNPIGTLAATQHANGMRRAGSVGFIPTKAINRTELSVDDDHYVDPKTTSPWRAGYKYFGPKLLEFSSVAIPANPDALQLQSYLREAESQEEALERTIREICERQHAEWVLRALQKDAAVRAAARALLLSEPPAKQPDNGLSSLFPRS